MSTQTPATRRPSLAARRVGYAIAIAVNLVLLYLINGLPGWQELPFLTADMSLVLPVVNLSLLAGAAANLSFMIIDTPWWKSAGDLITTSISLAVLVRFWQVYPFAFGGSFNWDLLVRILLIVATAGTGIAIVVHVVSLGRAVAGR
jgi:hypothetical protein